MARQAPRDHGPWLAVEAGCAVVPVACAPLPVTREAGVRCGVLPEAVLPEAALAAGLCAAGLWAELAAELFAEPLAEFVPGATPIFGWPVPVLETVVTG